MNLSYRGQNMYKKHYSWYFSHEYNTYLGNKNVSLLGVLGGY